MKVRLRIKEVAAEKGISMTKLSQRSEVAYNTVRKLMRDPYAEVTLSTLRRLADVLGVYQRLNRRRARRDTGKSGQVEQGWEKNPSEVSTTS